MGAPITSNFILNYPPAGLFTSSCVTTGKPGSIHILSIIVFSCQAPCQASFRPLLLGPKSSIQLPRWSCSKPWSGGQQGLERAWGMVTDFAMGRYKENSKQTDAMTAMTCQGINSDLIRSPGTLGFLKQLRQLRARWQMRSTPSGFHRN